MSHVRIFNHYIHSQYLLLGVIEFCLLVISVYVGTYLRSWLEPEGFALVYQDILPRALWFALIMMLCMIAMGVYQSRVREGLAGMALRTMVALFLLGFFALSTLFYITPGLTLFIGRGVLAFSVVSAFILTMLVRVVFYRTAGSRLRNRKVLIVGAGHQANKLVQELGDEAGNEFELHAFIEIPGAETVVSGYPLISMPASLRDYVVSHDIEEIVVAVDDRRRNDHNGAGIPLAPLLDCKLSGIIVLDTLSFLEREAGKIEPRSLSPGWLVFSDGFGHSAFRDYAQRGFDLFASLLLLAVAWPFMLLTFLAIKLEDGFRAPIFYSQARVGLNGVVFKVHKFRSMRTDAEKFGAVWAQENDPRITRVGRFIRNVRIDELPQIFNVLRGDMSFVGPRPERPEFVAKLKEKIPYFEERHRVKPGITGWAQLCYPYGASDEDSEQKLKYDLYYVKNRSLLLDLIILVQTVEVVLIGKGVR